jgi:hypothetical protein
LSLSSSLWHLVRTFGQAKGKRIYEQAERSKVDAEVVEAKITQAAENVTEDKLAEPDGADEARLQASRLTPKINRDATTVDQVYDINELLAEHEITEVQAKALAMKDDYDEKEKLDQAVKSRKLVQSRLFLVVPHDCLSYLLYFFLRFTAYFAAIWAKASLRKGQDEPARSLALCLYAEGLARLATVKDKDIPKGFSTSDYLPAGLRIRLLESFTEKG